MKKSNTKHFLIAGLALLVIIVTGVMLWQQNMGQSYTGGTNPAVHLSADEKAGE